MLPIKRGLQQDLRSLILREATKEDTTGSWLKKCRSASGYKHASLLLLTCLSPRCPAAPCPSNPAFGICLRLAGLHGAEGPGGQPGVGVAGGRRGQGEQGLRVPLPSGKTGRAAALAWVHGQCRLVVGVEVKVHKVSRGSTPSGREGGRSAALAWASSQASVAGWR